MKYRDITAGATGANPIATRQADSAPPSQIRTKNFSVVTSLKYTFIVFWKFTGVIWNKRCSPEKVSIIWHLQIDTLYTKNLDFIHHELTCSRPDQAKVGFCANAKIEDFNFKNEKSHVDKIYSFQLFVNFLIDSESPAIKFFKTGFR